MYPSLLLEFYRLWLCECIIIPYLVEKMSGGSDGYAILLVETADKKLKLYGSPRGDLEDVSEISEVNGRCLDLWPREHIADYVRRSILSRTLFLRVKPKKLPESVKDAKVQETFLISVSCHSISTKELPVLADDMTQSNNGQADSSDSKPVVTTVTKTETLTISVDSNTPTLSLEADKDIQKPQSSLHQNLFIKTATTDVNNDNVETVTPAEIESTMSVVQPAPVRHREMAVDCPDTFIAIAKTTPKYPLPKKNGNQEISSPKKTDLYYFTSGNISRHDQSISSHDGSENSRRTPPTPRISELMQYSKSNNTEIEELSNDNAFQNHPPNQVEGKELQERIKKYQEDIRKKKEQNQGNKDDFLYSSLRGSLKLRVLEKRYFSLESGVENTAFQLEEDDSNASAFSTSHKGRLVGDVANEPPELIKIYDPSELIEKLQHIGAFAEKTVFDEDLLPLEKLFHEEEFQVVLSLHNKIQALNCFRCLPVPIEFDLQDLTQKVIKDVQNISSKDVKELTDILHSLQFEYFVSCYDQVAESQITPDISEEEELLTRVSQYTEESIKIVRVDKTTEPLGATVRKEGEAIVVGRIVKGGVAEKSGLLHEGDEILEVNGLEIRGKSVNDVCDIMAGMSGNLTLLIVPSQYACSKSPTRETVIHLKAHFDYDPDDDLYIPCRELGMSFQKGDVLHIISQDDPNWWQAYREGEEDQMLAGLIPSKSFQLQREKMKQDVVGDIREKKSKKAKLLCARRKKKKFYSWNISDDAIADQILTYEEVYLYYPRAQHKRPLVLIGPQKIGRHELRQRLMEDTNRFAAAVPHTSRSQKDNEVDAVDYHFISRQQFEADILAGCFVEHGEYQKSYYGTSLDAIRSIINCRRTCVLNLHPQSLKILKKSDLKPYIVFVAPPSFEKLRQNCTKNDPAIKDEELKDIIEKAREMEEFYGHYFDLVLVNMDLEKTYSELLHAISVIEREPQWVPASWMQDTIE